MRIRKIIAAATITVAGAVAVAPVASAAFDLNPFPDVCVGEDQRGNWVAPAPDEYSAPGISAPYSGLVGSTFTAEDGETYNYGATGYEWFGGANALSFTNEPYVTSAGYDANPLVQAACSSGFLERETGKAMGFMWSIGVGLFDVSASLLEWSQTANIIPAVYDAIGDRAINGADTDGDGLGDNRGSLDNFGDLFFLALPVLIGALLLIAIYLIARGRMKEAGRRGAIFVLAITAGLFAMANTGWIVKSVATPVLTTAGNISSSVTSGVFAGLIGSETDMNLCVLDSATVNYPAGTSLRVDNVVNTSTPDGIAAASAGSGLILPSQAVRTTVCNYWAAGALPLWRMGQFGTTDPVMTVGTDAYNKAAGDPALQVSIPGLAQQTAAGELGLLHLSAYNLSPDEQRWLESYMKDNPEASRAEVINTYLRGGFRGEKALSPARVGEGGPFDDLPAYTYLNGATPVGAGVYASANGYQDRWETLIERVSDLKGNEYGFWSGATAQSQAVRANSGYALGATAALAGTVVGGLGAMALVYQLMFALMVVFIPIAAIAFAWPTGAGVRTGKEILANMFLYLLKAVVTMAFAAGAAMFIVAMPSLLGTTGSALAFNPWVFPISALLVGIAVFLAWRTVMKKVSGSLHSKMGTTEGGAFDIASKAKGAMVGTAIAAGAVTAAAATGGASAVAMGAKDMGGKAAQALIYNNGRGAGSAIKASAKATVVDKVAKDLPGVDDDFHQANLRQREEDRKRRREEKTKKRMDDRWGEGNHEYKTTEEKKAEERAKKEQAAADRAERATATAPEPTAAPEAPKSDTDRKAESAPASPIVHGGQAFEQSGSGLIVPNADREPRAPRRTLNEAAGMPATAPEAAAPSSGETAGRTQSTPPPPRREVRTETAPEPEAPRRNTPAPAPRREPQQPVAEEFPEPTSAAATTDRERQAARTDSAPPSPRRPSSNERE